jgi:uncharacterized membrane protein YraQ (UPF0718 family)
MLMGRPPRVIGYSSCVYDFDIAYRCADPRAHLRIPLFIRHLPAQNLAFHAALNFEMGAPLINQCSYAFVLFVIEGEVRLINFQLTLNLLTLLAFAT